MKILVVDLNFLGDMLMTSPIYRALKEFGFEVHTLGWDFCEEVLVHNPYIDQIWVSRSWRQNWFGLMKLRREKYDLIMQMNTSLKTNLFMSLLGGKTVGYSYKWKGFPLDVKVKTNHPSCTHGSRVDECCDLVERGLGIRVKNREMIFDSPTYSISLN